MLKVPTTVMRWHINFSLHQYFAIKKCDENAVPSFLPTNIQGVPNGRMHEELGANKVPGKPVALLTPHVSTCSCKQANECAFVSKHLFHLHPMQVLLSIHDFLAQGIALDTFILFLQIFTNEIYIYIF